MSNLVEARTDIEIEETQFDSGISESFAQKLGQSVNFVNRRQNNVFDFKFLGSARPLFGGEDGTRGFIFAAEIVGISGYYRIAGDSGSSVIDIHWLNSSGDQGTILSTKITIDNTATDARPFYKNLLDASSSAPSGVTLPVFQKTQFIAGDTLRVDLDSSSSNVRDLVLNIHYRPI